MILAVGASLGPICAQDGSAIGDGQMQILCIDEDRRAYPLEAIPGSRSTQIWSNPNLLAGERSPTHCWAWNEACPPHRVAHGEDAAGACKTNPSGSARLSIRVTSPGTDNGPPDGRTGLPDGVEIIAAPAEMWRETPISLLPTWATDSGLLSLPRGAEQWRLQARAEGRLSRPRDVSLEEDTVELVLLPAAGVSVQVTADRAPLAGARLSLVQPGRFADRRAPELLAFECTDDAGEGNLAIAESERSLVVVGSPARTAAAFQRFEDVPAVVELGPGYAVTGVAVNVAGDPVAEARLLGLSWIPNGGGLMQRHTGKTGADGRFRLTGFSPGTALLRTDGGNLAYSRQLDLDHSVDLGSIVLTSPEHVWLEIVNRDSRMPVHSASVQPAGGEWAAAGKDGAVLVSLVLGRSLLVKAKGYISASVELPDGAGQTSEEPFVIELEPAFTVEGTYVAADGLTPAADGRFVARRETDNMSSHRPLAPDGSFSIDLPAGAYSLELSAGNAGSRRLSVNGSSGEVRDLGVVAASASAGVSGHVLSPEFAPVAGASISRVRSSEMGPLMAWALGNVDRVTTNAEGYFELFGLDGGVSTLRVEAEGFAPMEFEVEAQAVEWVDAGTVELSRGRRVRVRTDVDRGEVVVDTGLVGNPRQFIRVAVVDGEALVERVPVGAFALQVLEDRVPVCEWDEQDETGGVSIRCDRSTVTVTGRVTIGDQAGDGMLLWQQKGRAALPEGGLITRGGPLPRTQVVSNRPQERQAMLNGEGRYRIEAVLPGNWEVIWMPLSGGQQDVREVEVPDGAGGDVVLDLDYGGVSLVGIVTEAGGAPATHATVDVFPSRRAVVADEVGRFQITGLVPGTYQLRARLRDLRSRLVDVELRTGRREAVDLVLVDDPPSDEVAIYLEGGGSGLCFVKADTGVSHVLQITGGTARQKLSPPLSRRLQVACRASGHWVLSDWRDLRQALDEGVVLDPFESTATLVLTGVAPGAPIEITGPGDWNLGALRLWFGGARTFQVGETISNLPSGSYTLNWGSRSRIVRVERGRATEVEINA
ncbi:MAG: carboxypeptidase-like regulatory domain-containing protein [Acidobacteria bacterium]|nr:carboxypeptidase-like regulatory domain-containing protein [Acidobacteriota bacterium]